MMNNIKLQNKMSHTINYEFISELQDNVAYETF